MPEVTVIIPVYNTEKYLTRCLDSVVNQTLREIEIICVNDGSTDKSLFILENYAKNDKRIVVINQENKGQGISRNNAMKSAQGKYLQFLDSDDWLEINACEKLYNFAEKNNAQVVLFNVIEEFENKKSKKRKSLIKIAKEKLNIDLSNSNCYDPQKTEVRNLADISLYGPAWCKFCKRDFIIKNNILFSPSKISEDAEFSAAVCLLCGKYWVYDEYLYHYYVRKNSISRNCGYIQFERFINIKSIENFLKFKGLFNNVKNLFIEYKINDLARGASKVDTSYAAAYEEKVKELLNDEEYLSYKKHLCARKSIFENIFSIKNEYLYNTKTKIITILGGEFRLSAHNEKIRSGNG